MSLSVCLLTRNEEHTVARALRSVAGLADEVLVADTASTDRTAEVAASLGAKVIPFAWDDDFAAGRNFTMARAAGDWVLWLNADEELLPDGHDHVRACTARDDVFGYLVRLHHLPDPNRPDRVAESTDLRLFRRRPDLPFVGRCHPRFDPASVAAIEREGRPILPCAVTLRSHAELGPRSEAKLRWTARLLELELRDRPGQLPYLIEYGRTLLLLKDPRGHAVLAEAAGQLLPVLQEPAAPSLKVQVLLEYLLSVSPAKSQTPLTRADAQELALRWFPASPWLLYMTAEDCFHRGEVRRAAAVLERLVALGRSGAYDRTRPVDAGLVGADALLNLAACYRRLGEPDRAEQCYRQLLASRDHAAQAAKQLAELQRQRPGGPASFSIGGPTT